MLSKSKKLKVEQKRIFIILSGLALFFLGWWIYFTIQQNRLYDEIDAARQEYREEISDLIVYEPQKGDHVESVKVRSTFDDHDYSAILFHTNLDKVTVRMQDDFNNIPMSLRCATCVKVMDEVRPVLDDYYKNSRYYQLFSENTDYEMMRYRGKSLDPDHDVEFTFLTSTYKYTFPAYGSMTVSLNGSNINYYKFSTKDGKATDFRDRYKSTSSKTTTTKKESKSSYSSGTKSKKSYSDPYDVDKYKSAQDFADDKYEEFYDYEDDYEDEDEAYDAAEDYWRKHHK